MHYGYMHYLRGRRSMRESIRWYERSLALDPDREKTHYQLIGSYAAVGDTQDAIDIYKARLAASPGDVGAHRLLASAYLAAGNYAEAALVVRAGLALAPDDAILVEQSGEVERGQGHPETALITWRRALELNRENISGHYSRAFLLERLGRLEEAVAEWEAIINWSVERGYEIDTHWPERELARLRQRLKDTVA